MSVFRCVLLVCLVSFAAAFGLLYFGSTLGYTEFRGGFAVLETDVQFDDKRILSMLEAGSDYFSGDPISESSQWVLLDEFDLIKTIPLDSYFSRVLPFDPRYDGYAEKLKDIFIKDENRYIYIPLKAGNWNSGYLDRRFGEFLGEIPFSVDYYRIGRPLFLYFIAFAAASFCLLIICIIKIKKNSGLDSILTLVPMMASLAFFGAAGIAYGALLIAFFTMLKSFLNDLVLPAGILSKKNTPLLRKIIKTVILPYIFYWIFLIFFIAAFTTIIIISNLDTLFLLTVTAASLSVFLFSKKIFSLSRKEHRRFTPVLIMQNHLPDLSFSVYILPFAAAAFFLLFYAPYMPAAYDTDNKFDTFVYEQDYYDHMEYQVSFSRRQVGVNRSNHPVQTYAPVFPGFVFDADGLPSMAPDSIIGSSIDVNDFPPFELTNLMEFFHQVNSGEKTETDGYAGGITELWTLLVLLLFILPVLFIGKIRDNSSNVNFDNLRRSIGDPHYGKQRNIGINWNKKPLYNNKNLLRVQKDA